MKSKIILFTDRYGVSNRRTFEDSQIPWIDGLPPKFIAWDCKLWQHHGTGMSAYHYREIESFIMVN